MRVSAILRRGVLTAAIVTMIAGTSACSADTSGAPSDSATTSSSTPTAEASDAPIEVTEHATGEQPEPVEVDVDGGEAGVGVTFSEIRIEPGAATGWHCHYGQLVAVVQEGELTHYAPTHPGGVEVYTAGESIVEGPGYRHEGVNEGDTDVVLWVTYIIPEGKPLAETDLSKCDP